jgi:hypothetical protein
MNENYKVKPKIKLKLKLSDGSHSVIAMVYDVTFSKFVSKICFLFFHVFKE